MCEVLRDLDAARGVGFEFGDGFVDNDRHGFVSRVTGLLVAAWGCGSPVATRDFTPKRPSRPGPLSRLFEQQGYCDVAPLLGQDVVGAAGRRRVHGFDADAPCRSAAAAMPACGKRMREPLPKITTSASDSRQLREVLGAQVLEAVQRPVDALAARS